jgi:type IV secretion system protein VirD4
MNREQKGKRARLIINIVGTITILALVPWLVSFGSYMKFSTEKDVFKSARSAADNWISAGYFPNIEKTLNDQSLLIGSGLLFLLFEMGLLFVLVPAGIMKSTNVPKNNGKWGPHTAGQGEFGSARWQNQADKEKSTNVWDTRTIPKKGGIVLGVDLMKGYEKFYLSSDDTHTLIIGATRSGKTRRTILPTIWQLAQAGESMVLTDPKGELCLSTMEYLKKQGYNVIIMNYREPEKSGYWNPMNKVLENLERNELSEAEQTAREIAESLVNATQKRSQDSFWQETAKSVLTAISMFIAIEADSPEQKHFYGANYLLGQLGRPDPNLYDEVPLTKLIDTLPIDHPARRAWYTAGIAGDKTRASIFANALTSIQILADRKIGWITSRQDHVMRDVGIDKTAVFLVIPDERSIYNVLATIYTDQLYQSLIGLANENGGRIPRRVNFLLDEFGNMPPLPDFDKKLTVAGGRGMRFTLVVQGIDQLEKLYERGYKTITGNCHTWIYLRTSDPKTAEEIEKRVGKYTIATTSSGMSTQYGGAAFKPSASSSTNLTGRSLLLADEIMRWTNDDGVLVLRVGEQPAQFPTPELSHLKANADYGLGDQKQTAELLILRNESLPLKKIKSPSVWQPRLDDFRTKYEVEVDEIPETTCNVESQFAVEEAPGEAPELEKDEEIMFFKKF